jgi:hypothetical protein
MTPGQCNMVVERLGDYLVEQGLWMDSFNLARLSMVRSNDTNTRII